MGSIFSIAMAYQIYKQTKNIYTPEQQLVCLQITENIKHINDNNISY